MLRPKLTVFARVASLVFSSIYNATRESMASDISAWSLFCIGSRLHREFAGLHKDLHECDRNRRDHCTVDVLCRRRLYLCRLPPRSVRAEPDLRAATNI